jgi:hypothetical protein
MADLAANSLFHYKNKKGRPFEVVLSFSKTLLPRTRPARPERIASS